MTSVATAHDVLAFWIHEVPRKNWYIGTPELDASISERFEATWARAAAGGTAPWTAGPEETLASVILLDQFPRNMFRDEPRAFVTDPLALATARAGLAAGASDAVEPPELQFLLMPFCHAEDMGTQDEGVALTERLMPDGDVLLHARAHREVIQRFGRFPFRNKALGRQSTEAELAFLDGGGYGAIVKEMEGAGAA